MNNICNLRILIVGLTTVLSLASFNKSDFCHGIIQHKEYQNIHLVE
ncbi:hypothetical protein [Flavobacterium sp. FlaQc-48]